MIFAMKKTSLLPLLLLIWNTAYCQLDEPYIVRTSTSGCLNVREDHDTNATSIACLSAGTQVRVIGVVPFWREIAFGENLRGWVAKKFIEPAAPNDTTISSLTIPPNAFLTVHFIDVGQGDAIWIQTHDDGIDGNSIFEGHSIVIDGGPYSADDENPLLGYLERQGHHAATIEALFLTHPHNDHYNGAETISRHFDINHYYDPGYPSTLDAYVAFLNAIKGDNEHAPRARNVHIGLQNFGQINWGNELQVDVLYSWQGDSQNTLGSGNTEINNASIVLKIQYGTHSFLFMGDAEGKDRDDDPQTPRFVEQVLLQTHPTRLQSTVLKIAHHGSETSSTIPFIEAVNPEIVIAQSGRRSFGGTFLPDVTTLQRYCAHNPNVKIYRTDQDDESAGHTGRNAVDGDDIVIRTNGSGQVLVTALQGGQPFNGNFCGH